MARMQPPGDHPRGQRLVWTNRKRDRELQLRLFQFEGFLQCSSLSWPSTNYGSSQSEQLTSGELRCVQPCPEEV